MACDKEIPLQASNGCQKYNTVEAAALLLDIKLYSTMYMKGHGCVTCHQISGMMHAATHSPVNRFQSKRNIYNVHVDLSRQGWLRLQTISFQVDG